MKYHMDFKMLIGLKQYYQAENKKFFSHLSIMMMILNQYQYQWFYFRRVGKTEGNQKKY